MSVQKNDGAEDVLSDKKHTSIQKNCQPSNGVIEKDLLVPLEDLLKPCKKEETIERINGNNRKEQKTFSIELFAGTKEETPITFRGEGNGDSSGRQGDVIFTVKYEEHPHFTVLDGVHLQYIAQISPEESVHGCLLSVPTLDGEPICLLIEESIPDQSEERISNRGLRLNGNSPERGDLIIQFKVQGKSSEAKEEKDLPEYQAEIENNGANDNYQRANSSFNANKHAPIELELEVTLEEIFSGCKKNLKFTRWVIEQNGKQTREEKELIVEVERGVASNFKKTFPNEGDRLHGYLPGDVICTFLEKPHSVFQRQGDNLLYNALVTEHQYANCSEIEIPSLDGERAFLELGKVKGIGQSALLVGRGLPNFHEPRTRGDIVIKVDIQSEQTTPKRVKLVRSNTAKLNLAQDPPIRQTIALPLEDFIQGCVRKFSRKRIVIDSKTEKSNIEITQFSIEVEANSCIGQVKVIPQMGDQHRGRIAADLHVTLNDKPHPLLARRENDLHFSLELSESEEKSGLLVPIPALLRSFQINTKEYNLKEVIPFANEGMPDKTGKRGYLYVHFTVISDKYKDETIVREVPLNWSELIKGTVKRYNIRQLRTEPNGTRTEMVHPIELNLRPGIQIGTTFVYNRLGDIHEGKLAADITFRVTEKDSEFVRYYANLQCQISVPSEVFQVGKQIEVRTSICCEALLLTQKMIDHKLLCFKGFGLPYPNNPFKRGDLIVHLNPINQANQDERFIALPEHDSPKLETEMVTLTLEQILSGHSLSYQLTPHNQEQLGLQYTHLTIPRGLIAGSTFVKRFKGRSVTFQIKAREHSTFQTQGHNLLYTKTVSLIEALCDCVLQVPLLGSSKQEIIDIQEIIHPNFEYKVSGQGLPCFYNEKQGDLRVKFKIEFSNLENGTKKELTKVLKNNFCNFAPRVLRRSKDERWLDNRDQIQKFKAFQKENPSLQLIQVDLKKLLNGGIVQWKREKEKQICRIPTKSGLITQFNVYMIPKEDDLFKFIDSHTLSCTVQISLYHALTGNFSFYIENSILKMRCNVQTPVAPGDFRVYENVFKRKKGEHGIDLIVHFTILFPRSFSEPEKAYLRTVFGSSLGNQKHLSFPKHSRRNSQNPYSKR